MKITCSQLLLVPSVLLTKMLKVFTFCVGVHLPRVTTVQKTTRISPSLGRSPGPISGLGPGRDIPLQVVVYVVLSE